VGWVVGASLGFQSDYFDEVLARQLDQTWLLILQANVRVRTGCRIIQLMTTPSQTPLGCCPEACKRTDASTGIKRHRKKSTSTDSGKCRRFAFRPHRSVACLSKCVFLQFEHNLEQTGWHFISPLTSPWRRIRTEKTYMPASELLMEIKIIPTLPHVSENTDKYASPFLLSKAIIYHIISQSEGGLYD
jgi:hypothetical protein